MNISWLIFPIPTDWCAMKLVWELKWNLHLSRYRNKFTGNFMVSWGKIERFFFFELCNLLWWGTKCFLSRQFSINIYPDFHALERNSGEGYTHIYIYTVNRYVNKLYAFLGYNYRVFRNTFSRIVLLTWYCPLFLVRSKNLNHELFWFVNCNCVLFRGVPQLRNVFSSILCYKHVLNEIMTKLYVSLCYIFCC